LVFDFLIFNLYQDVSQGSDTVPEEKVPASPAAKSATKGYFFNQIATTENNNIQIIYLRWLG